ncbi:MAG: hypothetical protein OEU36_20570 [Gammaproteobacteria bacterium]|nr:hypothetical protein [Gammaproteobacteria bacterium]
MTNLHQDFHDHIDRLMSVIDTPIADIEEAFGKDSERVQKAGRWFIPLAPYPGVPEGKMPH